MKRWIGALLALLYVFCAMGAACAEEPTLVAFAYSQGGYPDDDYEFKVYTDESGQTYVSAQGFNGVNLFMRLRVDKAVFAELERIVDQYDLRVWDGFHQTEPEIMDGHLFALEMEFSDGTHVVASGHMRYPAGYEEANAAIMAYFLPWGKGDGE